MFCVNKETDACNFYGKQSVYDDHGGVALAQEEGREIAAALGEKNTVCILKNHGFVCHPYLRQFSKSNELTTAS